MNNMTPLETKLLAELTRLQSRLYRAENALRALGYEPHGVGWAIQVANPIPHDHHRPIPAIHHHRQPAPEPR